MAPRLQLQSLLETIVPRVYFQPPNNLEILYPCIVYAREGSRVVFADNRLYSHAKQYQVTVIDRNPDSLLPDQVEELRYSRFDRFFSQDSLNHWVFTLFF